MAIEQTRQPPPEPEPLVYLHTLPDQPTVHCLALNRNKARNALSKRMVREMHELIGRVGGDRG